MLNSSTCHSCPVCSSPLVAKGRDYTVEELFKLWEPVTFSQHIMDEHRQVASATRLHNCPECGLGIFLPQIIGTPGFYVEAYNLGGTQKDSEFTYANDKWEFNEALQDTEGCMRAIEFGCGNGNFLGKLGKSVPEIAGIEYNPSAIETARARGFLVFPGADPSVGASWDAAFSFHVLEHVADPVGFIRQIRAAVKPGGLIGISVPDQDGPIKFIEPCIMNMPPHHATRWRLATFEALARRLGLEIRRVAREPLSLDNHGYYSVHWVSHFLPGSSLPVKAARKLVSLSLRAFFGGLRRLGIRVFPFLPGQSLYVLMATPTAIESTGS